MNHSTQNGFFSITAIAVIGAAVVIGGLALALKVQSARLEAKSAQLDACHTNYEQALAAIGRQNKAVADIKKEADKRATNAATALKAAKVAGSAKDAEIARLSAFRGDSGLSCGKAVETVKSGLK